MNVLIKNKVDEFQDITIMIIKKSIGLFVTTGGYIFSFINLKDAAFWTGFGISTVIGIMTIINLYLNIKKHFKK